MALTAQQQLDLIDAAIQDITNGQAASYSIGSRSVTKHDLGKLFEIRKDLLRQVNRESGNDCRSAKIVRVSPS